jgi:hypothetical protein
MEERTPNRWIGGLIPTNAPPPNDIVSYYNLGSCELLDIHMIAKTPPKTRSNEFVVVD